MYNDKAIAQQIAECAERLMEDARAIQKHLFAIPAKHERGTYDPILYMHS